MEDITMTVLDWALHAETDEQREYYWALYDEACERKKSK